MNHNIFVSMPLTSAVDFHWLIRCIAVLHFITAHLHYGKLPFACYIDTFLFRSLNANSWLIPWIGLSKSEDKCPSGDSGLDCRSRGWRWEDDTPYLYPSWHKWRKNSPGSQRLCARLYSDDGTWLGGECSELLSYVCEKGMYALFNAWTLLHCVFWWHLLIWNLIVVIIFPMYQ